MFDPSALLNHKTDGGMKKNQWVKFGIGIDVSKDKLHVCFGGVTENQSFKIIAQRRFSNAEGGHKELLAWLNQKRKDATCEWLIVLEVTGVYHEQVLHYLHKAGIPVCLELAKRTKHFFKSIGQDSKNDKLDGRGLSRYACERTGLRIWEPVSEHIYEIRSLLRHRAALVTSRTQYRNQLHAYEHSAYSVKSLLRSLEKLIGELNKEIEKMERKALTLAKKDPELYRKVMQIVDSLPGVGLLTVLLTVGETNGFKAFSSEKQLTSYAGYDIIENQSGTKAGKTKISKRGNKRIRSQLYMAANTAIRVKAEPFYNLYERVFLRSGGIYRKANVAVQRKLLLMMYTLWKKDEPFDPEYYKLQKSEKRSSSDMHRSYAG